MAEEPTAIESTGEKPSEAERVAAMSKIHSTGEVLSERQREQAAVKAIRAKLMRIEQELLVLGKLEAASDVMYAVRKLTEKTT